MKKKIYVVTRGEYSDYGICAIFSTKEKAQTYCDAVNKPESWSSAGIEEWGLDDVFVENGTYNFFVRMKRDGEIVECYRDDGRDASYGFDMQKNLFSHVFAKDEPHAIKVTNERRGQLIAENKWPE